MFYNLSGDVRSPTFVSFSHYIFIQNYFSNKIFLESASCPAWEVIYCYILYKRLYIVSVRNRLVLLQTCLSLGGGSVAVACGARLSCSVFMVYSVLLFVSLVASAPI